MILKKFPNIVTIDKETFRIKDCHKPVSCEECDLSASKCSKLFRKCLIYNFSGDNILGASIVLEKYDKTKNTK